MPPQPEHTAEAPVAGMRAPQPSAHQQSPPALDDHHDSALPIVGMEDFSPEDRDPRPLRPPPLRRVLLLLGILATLAALLFVPPLVSMNHYRRQIASSISASLGRPVRIDSVALNLLPMPGFTLHNFIVGEDPVFGSEPVIRANSVTVTLRVSSLWGRRVEFSRILLESPSVNLVRLPDGRWNLESILLQASHVKAAPTAQRAAGPAPRFPYIEATGARVNLKSGVEKLPISLTEASFALWLPQPDRWNLRLEAHPARTDTAATDTGTLRLEGSLGRGPRLTDVPLNLSASWANAPLGAASWILLGRDAGLRGDLTLRASATGSAGDSVTSAQLQINSLRRADFVPEQPLAIDLQCGARALALFHRLEQIRCTWPSAATSTQSDAGLTLTGTVPDVTNPASAQAHAVFRDVPAALLLNALKAASPRIDPGLNAAGMAFGDLHAPDSPPLLPSPHKRRTPPPQTPSQPDFSGTLGIKKFTLASAGATPFVNKDVSAAVTGLQITFSPIPVELGAPTPATLSAQITRTGYSLHLAGPLLRSRLALLARSLPQLGDGLPPALLPPPPTSSESKTPESVLRVDLDATRTWRGGQTWTSATTTKPATHHRTSLRRAQP